MSWSGEATGFALQTVSVKVSRAVGWASQLLGALVRFLVGQAEAALSAK